MMMNTSEHPESHNINIHDDENDVLVVRKHWFLLAEKVFFLVILFFILAVGIFILTRTLSTIIMFTMPVDWFLLGTLFLIMWSFGFVAWTNYHLDVWRVTTKRVFDVEQHSFFTRDISEFRLDKIQDITVRIAGVIPTMLDFGDVYVQTAGNEEPFAIKNVPHPHRVRDALSQEVDRVLKGKFYTNV